MGEIPPARGSILGKCIPARYILAVLGSIGMAIIYGLKVNLSVAMVAMVNHTALASLEHSDINLSTNHSTEEICKSASKSSEEVEDGPFTWSEPLQGTLLSCYFWGYFVSQMPGARIAELYSAKWVMFFSVGINVVCTLLTPCLTELHYVGLIILRVLEGIGGGATFPAMHVMLAAWAPPNERSVMSTIVYAGTCFGTAKSILLAGVFASSFGWESVFYIMGGLSIIWMILWVVLVEDSPNKQKWISEEEREMITSQLGTGRDAGAHGEKKKLPIPWRKVFTSLPFWAILIAHVCGNWGWYMFLIEIPFYMKQVLKFNVSENAWASARPYYPMLVGSILLSKLLDTLKTKGKITTTTARKTATLIASLIPAICLLILCFIGCRHTAAVAVMSLGIVAMGGMFCGYLSNHIDIGPNYAGTLVALTNTIATLPGIIVPIFVGFITKGNQTIDAWKVIFFVTVALFCIEIIAYMIMGSGEEQSWNKQEEIKEMSNLEKVESTEQTPLNDKSLTN